MRNLNLIVLRYLHKFKDRIIFTDQHKSYSGYEFLKKVKSYKSQLKNFWKNSQHKGIAIVLDRNADYISIIFATWLSGGFYVPLSTETNQAINKKLIKISKVNLVVYNFNNKIIFKKIVIKKNFFLKYKKLAYIIFTSGSTGEKKAVCISRENIYFYIKAIQKVFKKKYKPKSIIINGELTFDITLADFAFAFVFFSEIILTSSSKNLLSLLNLLKLRKAESLYLVPTTLKRLIFLIKKLGISYVSTIKQINSGGEKLDTSLVNEVKKIFKKISFYNFYGPTEFTVNSTIYNLNLKKDLNIIPIGKALPGVKYLIKKNKNSENGELLLAGKQLMQGYLNYKNPFINFSNVIYYPTGDIVKENKKKEIIFIGRNQDYIKHKGYRINTDKIIKRISAKLEINFVLKVINKKLILFVETKKSPKIINVLDNRINKNLEFHEKPDQIIFKNKFPTLSSGKIDIKKLK